MQPQALDNTPFTESPRLSSFNVSRIVQSIFDMLYVEIQFCMGFGTPCPIPYVSHKNN